MTVGLLLLGGIVYHTVEGYSWLDSFYMSVITLATVGYGDYVPHTVLGKLFTMVYVLFGIGILVSVFSTVSKGLIERRTDIRMKRKEHHPSDT